MPEPRPRRAPHLLERILELGALRVALLAAVAVLAASAFFAPSDPFAGAAFEGTDPAAASGASPFLHASFGIVWTTLVAPPLAVMMAFVIPLDMLMSRIYMTDQHGAERARFRRILAVEALAFVLLVAAWAPFFVALLAI